MATSTQKVAAAINQAAGMIPELQQSASGMPAIALGAIRPLLPSLLDMVRAQVPEDPEALDALLDGAARYVLSLKSDPPADAETDAEPLTVHTTSASVAAELHANAEPPPPGPADTGDDCVHGLDPRECLVCSRVAA